MQATIHTPVLQQDISVAIKEYKSSDCALHLFLTPDSLAFGELSVETKVLNSYKKYAFPTINGNAEVVDLLKWLFANDEVLLQKLAAVNYGGNAKQWRQFRNSRWSKFDSSTYEEVIALIRSSLPVNEPLWKIEQHWKGYQ